MRSCEYPLVVYDHGLGNGGAKRPKRRPGARGFVTVVRRAGGTRYLPRIYVDHAHTRDVPGGAHATRAQAQAALELALAITRPCGADVFGEGDRCYYHAKLSAPLEVNGHAPAWDGWHPIDVDGATLEAFTAHEHRMREQPPPTCVTCGRPTRYGERGPIMYCSSACKSTGQTRRRKGHRPAINPATGRLLVRDRREHRA